MRREEELLAAVLPYRPKIEKKIDYGRENYQLTCGRCGYKKTRYLPNLTEEQLNALKVLGMEY